MWGFLQWLFGGNQKKPGMPMAEPKVPGLFTEGGVTYGEEALGLSPAERVSLAPEEIERRRARNKTAPVQPKTFLTGDQKPVTPWTQQQWRQWKGTRATMAARKGGTVLGG